MIAPAPPAPFVSRPTPAAEPSAPAAPAYRIDRLLESEPAPVLTAPPPRTWVWGLAVLLLSSIMVGLSGDVPPATELPVATPPRTVAPRLPALLPMAEGEWLTLVGTPAGDSSAPTPTLLAGWGILAAPRLDAPFRPAPTFEAVLWGVRGVPVRIARAGAAAAHRLLLGHDAGATPLWRNGSSLADAPPLVAAGTEAGLDGSRAPGAVTLPPAYDGTPHHSGAAAWVEGTNYTDPVGAALPRTPARSEAAAPVQARWVVVLAKHASLSQAEDDLLTFEPVLARSGLRPVLRASRVNGTTSHDIVVGPFASAAAAGVARDLAAPALDGPLFIVRFDNE